MSRLFLFLILLTGCSHAPIVATTSPLTNKVKPEWIAKSNQLAAEFTLALAELHPEVGSELGYTQFDHRGLLLNEKTEDLAREFFSSWQKKLDQMASNTQEIELRTDVRVLHSWVNDQVKQIDVSRKAHEIEFNPASKIIYINLQTLLNPQSPASRKAAAVDRFKVYLRGDDKHQPLISAFQKVYLQKLNEAKGNSKFLPYRLEVEEYLKDSPSYVAGIKELLQTSGREDWEIEFSEFEKQIAKYNQFVKNRILPSARKDPRLVPMMYAQAIKRRGMDVEPEQLIEMGLAGYRQLDKEFKAKAVLVAQKHRLKQNDPASVIMYLKSKSVTAPSEVEQLYKKADERLNAIMKVNDLISIPTEPLKIRIAGEAESKAAPVPHLVPPPLIDNNGIRPEFVVPSAIGGLPFDDFSSPYSAMILTAHEGRPGHDMQFSQMLDHGVSIIRSRYALNSVNVEGWALYAEDLVFQYLEPEEQLFALQTRLWRMARTFLDPQIQLGKIKGDRVIELFTKELGVSKTMANLELRRYTYDDVGQAPSYYYGYLLVKQMRQEAESRLGEKFNLKCFNDLFLSYGAMPLKITAERIKTDLKCTR